MNKKITRLAFHSESLRILLTAILLAWSIGSANAAEWLFVGTYYTRGSSESCANGSYIVRDAKSEKDTASIRAEFEANEKYFDKIPFRFQRGQVAAIYRYESPDVNYLGAGSCTYTRYGAVAAHSTAEAEKLVKRKPQEYPSSYASEPSIILFWSGDDVERKK
jgi:hypothetical protein